MTDQSVYVNPWEDAVITTVFTAPSSKTYTVGGFSFDGSHTWKVRFAPMEAGVWTWTMTYQVSDNGALNGQFTTNGSFNVTLLNGRGLVSSGFVKFCPTNGYRLITEVDGKTWSPRILNMDGPEKPENRWRTDEQGVANTLPNYFKCNLAAGLNCFCDDIGYLGYISAWTNNGTAKNIYNAANCLWWDQFCAMSHNTGMRLLHNMFPAQSTLRPWDTADQNYLKYVINRYGAYTDIWQFMIDLSSSGVNVADGNSAVAFIKSYDPYHHPISGGPNGTPPSNWDIISTQGYMGNNLNQIDFTQAWTGDGGNGCQQYTTKYGRPMVYSEGGTQYWWSPDRFRIMTWTAFFTYGGIGWWDGGPDHGGVGGVAYVGPDERAANNIHDNFLSDFDPAATPLDLMGNYNGQGQANPVRCWALGSSTDMGAYIVNGGDQNLLQIGKQVTLTVPADNMQGMWFDPSKGRIIQLFTVNSGLRTLPIPPFSEDIVLRLRANAPQAWVEFDTSAYSAQDTNSTVTLTVNRFGNGSGAVSVNYATGDALAQAGVDYQATTGTVSWAANDVAPKTITVPLLHVPMCKSHRNFNVLLSNPGGIALGTASRAVVSITSTVFSQGDYTRCGFVGFVTSGAVGFKVNRIGDSSGSLTLSYGTRDFDAVAGVDYVAANGTLSWSPGDTAQKTITVQLLPSGSGAAKVFFMLLGDMTPPTDALDTQGLAWYKTLGWVLPPASTNYTFIEFKGYDSIQPFGSGFPYPVYSVPRSAGVVNIPVSRINTVNDYSGAASLQYSTTAGDAMIVGHAGTVAGADYTTVNHATVNWATGDSNDKYLTVQINTNRATTGCQDFLVQIGTFNGVNGWPQAAIVSIVDAVPTLVAPPIILVQPVSQVVFDQQTAAFSVLASGNPLAYQWSRNGSPIPGATNGMFSIPTAQTGDAGAFVVVVSNSGGSVTSAVASLTVNPVPPGIVNQPADQWVLANQTATFNASVSGTVPLTYQWNKNGSPIGGAAGVCASAPATVSYKTPAALLTDDGAIFQVSVSNGTPPDAVSTTATLHVRAVPVAPTIATPPADQTVNDGQTATFSVVANGTPPLAYQWQKNSHPINGATHPSYTTPPTTPADNGATFRVAVSNGTQPDAVSAAATLTVTPVAPGFTTQPVAQTVSAGQSATFGVVVSGSAPLSFRWMKDGCCIPGAYGTNYTTPPSSSSDNGAHFTVMVTNVAGAATSSVATLTVTPSPVPAIVTQPANLMVTAGQQATLAVLATGTPLFYRWQDKNGVAVSGATNSAYTILSTTTNNNGDQYRVVVSNSLGSVTSVYAMLTVTTAAQAPTILAQPTNQTAALGQTATFTVGATATAPLSYKWYKDGVQIPNVTTAAYTTPPVTAGDNGAFFAVKVSNASGNVTASNVVLLVSGAPTFVARVNFQTSSSNAPTGYQADWGQLKGANTYGWNAALGNTRERGVQPDKRMDTLAMSQVVDTWSYTITNGYYLAKLVCGDPQWAVAAHLVVLQDTTVVDNQPTAVNQFITISQPVHVTNGVIRITIGGGTPAAYTTITYVDIQNVATPAAIQTQPTNAVVTAGQSVSFTVVATGSPMPAYQWQLDGKNISGATLATYAIGSAQAGDAGTYAVIASNSAGCVTSTPVTLSVIVPQYATHGTPKAWLALYGLADDSADDDGDGATTWQEYVTGTDPTNPASCLRIVTVSNAVPSGATGLVVRWSSATGKYYRVDRGTNLLSVPPFDFNVATNIPAMPPINTQTDTNATGNGPYFYRIGVQ